MISLALRPHKTKLNSRNTIPSTVQNPHPQLPGSQRGGPIEPRQIRVKGFIGEYSQVLAIAQLAFFIGGATVDGLAVLRGWVARNESIRQELKVGYEATPVLWTAGDEDDVVTPAITMKSLELVDEFAISVAPTDQGFSENGVAVKSYDCGEGHKPNVVAPKEVADLMVWLEQAMRVQYLYLVTSVQRAVVELGRNGMTSSVHYIIVPVAVPGVLSK